MITSVPNPPEIIYPETDGKPMAENTIQFDWILLLFGELDERFRKQDEVFVAGDLFWYPEEGKLSIVQAPDVMVVFGRPKGHRSSYRQWEEDDVAPQVVFEIFSPSNDKQELDEKLSFYQTHGVEEYYFIDPYKKTVDVYRRRKKVLAPVRKISDWQSPRLGIRFEKVEGELIVLGPEGGRFMRRTERFDSMATELDEVRIRADKERDRAEKERDRAEKEREAKEALAAKLRELGVDPSSFLS
jgi:Uma2 family endonuclease